jgi:LuxR family maltose regulon positive regulatory protein
VRLVLDDVHEIVGHPAQRALRALVRHPVPGLTVVLCSRFDPPIGLDRLRLEGRLGELRVDKLAFSVTDVARLFDLASLPLSPEQAVTLVDRTEGWVAALRLIALSLQNASDRSSVLADFDGDDRAVADYLVDEVLSKLDVRERRAIEVTCACSPIAVDLVGVVRGPGRRPGGRALRRARRRCRRHRRAPANVGGRAARRGGVRLAARTR